MTNEKDERGEKMGLCDGCSTSLHEKDYYYSDGEGTMLCKTCEPSLQDCVESMLAAVMKKTPSLAGWSDGQLKDAGNWARDILNIVSGDSDSIPEPPDILRCLMEPVDFFVIEAGARGFDKVFTPEVLDSWSDQEKAEVFCYIAAKATDVLIQIPAPDCIIKLYSHPKGE